VTLPAAILWVNGERVAESNQHVSARDRGLTLADGLFETMRVHAGTVFRLDQHLARLHEGLHRLAIPAPSSVRKWIEAAAAAADGHDSSIRLTITRGVAPGGVAPPDDPRPTVIVALNPMPVLPRAIYERGLSAHIASGRRNEFAMTRGLKTLAYTDAVVGLLEAQRAGADEALFLDTEAHCSEATSSNLFMWDGTTLVTPPTSCAALPGITRAAVLELAHAFDVPTAERSFGLEDLVEAEEAFLTSSLRAVAPLVRIGSRRIGAGTPGVLTRRLMAAYHALVAHECSA
jgi:branched-chain amino acid aminotransferase